MKWGGLSEAEALKLVTLNPGAPARHRGPRRVDREGKGRRPGDLRPPSALGLRGGAEDDRRRRGDVRPRARPRAAGPGSRRRRRSSSEKLAGAAKAARVTWRQARKANESRRRCAALRVAPGMGQWIALRLARRLGPALALAALAASSPPPTYALAADADAGQPIAFVGARVHTHGGADDRARHGRRSRRRASSPSAPTSRSPPERA